MEMGRFEGFESPVAQVKQAAATADEIREHVPHATALVDELKAAYPELFAGATVLRLADIESGNEVTTAKYREIASMRKASVTWWDSVTAACARNRAAVESSNRRRK